MHKMLIVLVCYLNHWLTHKIYELKSDPTCFIWVSEVPNICVFVQIRDSHPKWSWVGKTLLLQHGKLVGRPIT